MTFGRPNTTSLLHTWEAGGNGIRLNWGGYGGIDVAMAIELLTLERFAVDDNRSAAAARRARCAARRARVSACASQRSGYAAQAWRAARGPIRTNRRLPPSEHCTDSPLDEAGW